MVIVGVATASLWDLDLAASKITVGELFGSVNLGRENILKLGLSAGLIALWNEGRHSAFLLIFRVLDDYLVVVFFLFGHGHILRDLFFQVGEASCVFGVFFHRRFVEFFLNVDGGMTMQETRAVVGSNQPLCILFMSLPTF